jgi:hypothetical protein
MPDIIVFQKSMEEFFNFCRAAAALLLRLL